MIRNVLTYVIISSLLVVALSLIIEPVKYEKKTEPDYEMDLTERCKDWLYWRAEVIKRHREGDENGTKEARRYMNAFMRDLEDRFSSEQISEEIARLENEARLRNIPPWSSSIGK